MIEGRVPLCSRERDQSCSKRKQDVCEGLRSSDISRHGDYGDKLAHDEVGMIQGASTYHLVPKGSRASITWRITSDESITLSGRVLVRALEEGYPRKLTKLVPNTLGLALAEDGLLRRRDTEVFLHQLIVIQNY